MSHFYGTLQGSRGEATRCGTKGSGIYAVVASYSGAITVEIKLDRTTGEEIYTVIQQPWRGSGISRLLARGVVGSAVIHDYVSVPPYSPPTGLLPAAKKKPSPTKTNKGIPIGALVRVKSDCGAGCGYFWPGDVGVWLDDNSLNCDFSGRGNPEVNGDGCWAVNQDWVDIIALPRGYVGPIVLAPVAPVAPETPLVTGDWVKTKVPAMPYCGLGGIGQIKRIEGDGCCFWVQLEDFKEEYIFFRPDELTRTETP